jgi:hypothetical protein
MAGLRMVSIACQRYGDFEQSLPLACATCLVVFQSAQDAEIACEHPGTLAKISRALLCLTVCCLRRLIYMQTKRATRQSLPAALAGAVLPSSIEFTTSSIVLACVF